MSRPDRHRADAGFSLEIDPRALRLSAADPAAEIRDVVNRALDARSDIAARDARAAGQTPAGELREIQNDSLRSMATFMQTLRDATERLEPYGDRQ